MESDGLAPETQSAEGLTAAAFRGMSWNYVTAGAVAVVQVFYVAVTSRLLAPRAFGLYAIALLAMNTADTFAGMGVAQAIIQRESVSKDDVRASSTSGVGLGIFFFASLWLLAPAVARFFTEPAAIPVLRLMGVHFIFIGFELTSQALLRRDHRFRELAIASSASNVIGYGLVGPVMAITGFGVWSLCGAVLSAHFLGAIFSYLYVRHPLQPIFTAKAYKDLYGFGARVSVLVLLEFFGKQMDTFAVGRYTTTALLGQYSRAFVILNLPIGQHLRQAITRVMFPGFSRIQMEVDRVNRAYLSVVMLCGTLLLAVGAGMAVAAREIVLVLLGGQWDVAIKLVPFFAIAVVFNVMTRFAELVCQARAELNKVIALQAVYLVLLAGAYLTVSSFRGVLPFAAALAVGEVARHLAFTGLMRRVFGTRYVDVAVAYAPAVVAAAGVAAMVFLGRQTVRIEGFPIQAVLVVEMLCGALGLALFIRFNPFTRLREELHSRLVSAGILRRRGGGLKTKLAMLLLGDS